MGLPIRIEGYRVNDKIPPLLQGNLSCGELDTLLTDLPAIDSIRSNLAQFGNDSSGIGWVHGGYPDTTFNFNDTILAKSAGFSRAWIHPSNFNIHVIDVRYPAHGALFALDRAGNDTTYYFDYVPDSIAVFPDTTDFGIVQNNASAVDTIVLVNPLSDNVSIDSLWLQGNESFSIVGESAPLRVNLLGGDTERIYVKFSPGKGNVSDSATIMAQFDCFSRPLTVVSGTTGVPFR